MTLTDEQQEANNAALNVRTLHPNIRQLFKIRCAEIGMPMEQVAKQLLEKIAFRELSLKDLGIRPR